MTCPDSFSVGQSGELVGDAIVRRLEKNCLSSSTNVNGLPGLGGCSKCFHVFGIVILMCLALLFSCIWHFYFHVFGIVIFMCLTLLFSCV